MSVPIAHQMNNRCESLKSKEIQARVPEHKEGTKCDK